MECLDWFLFVPRAMGFVSECGFTCWVPVWDTTLGIADVWMLESWLSKFWWVESMQTAMMRACVEVKAFPLLVVFLKIF